jgi:hypothetical protein
VKTLTFKGHAIVFDEDLEYAPCCPRCHAHSTQPDGIGNWWCAVCERWFHVCEKCGKPYTAPMSPLCRDNHEMTGSYRPFTPYFDIALGQQVDSHGQRMRLMRGETTCDGDEIRPRLEYRDHPSKGDLAARRDRLHERRKAEGRE